MLADLVLAEVEECCVRLRERVGISVGHSMSVTNSS